VIAEQDVSPEAISIKGIRQGLLVTLHQGRWEYLLAELERRLTAQPSFFKGGRVSLDVGSLSLTEDDLRAVRNLLIRHDVSLHAVVSQDAQTEAAAQALGLVIDLGLDRRPLPEPPPAPASPGDSDVAILVQRTLRSGQTIRHRGHVTVIGDVNPGAEIIAGGHIVVWGKLRGTVHAGATGDEQAQVCALELAPTQLRIAGYITRSPEERRQKSTPEVATVRDGQIVALPWK
jgi:septum site-determining protein MinC